jgi:starch phosphorylase
VVEAVVALGDLGPDDVQVQAVHGRVVRDGDLVDTELLVMAPAEDVDDGHLRYRGTLPVDRAGRHGLTVRVVPWHPLLVAPVELGLIAWAGNENVF